jgi:hypothetical protein
MSDLITESLVDSPALLYDFRDGLINTDSGPNGLDGTNTNVTAAANGPLPGEIGAAHWAKASNSKFQRAPNAAIDNLFSASTKAASFGCMFKMDSLPGANHYVLASKKYVNGYPGWVWYISSSTKKATFRIHRSTGYETNSTSANALVADVWYFFQVVVFADGTNPRWWLNGLSKTNTSLSTGAGTYPTDASHDLTIGYGIKTGEVEDWHFDGDISYFGAFDSDIGDTRLQAHYDAAANGSVGGVSGMLPQRPRWRRTRSGIYY